MGNFKFYAAAFTMAGLASLPLVAQNPQSPSADRAAQSAPARLDPASLQMSPSQQDGSAQSAGHPGAAQQSSSPAVPVTSTANSPEVSNSELRPVQGELEKKLDAKSAKVGDAVVVRTTEQAATSSGLVIPKGSKIVGHVVDAQPTGKDTQNSKVTVQFDQAQLKGGHTLPIRTLLQSVAPAAASSAPEASAASAATPPAAGASGGATPTAGSQEPTGGSAIIPQNSRSATSGGAAPITSGSNVSAGNTAPAAGTVVAQRGDIAIKTTGIPGVLLATNATGQPFSNAAGAILGARQNVHLDSGTHVVLAVTDAATKGTSPR